MPDLLDKLPDKPSVLDSLPDQQAAPGNSPQSNTPALLKGGLLDSSLPITERLKRIFTGQPEQNLVGPEMMKIPGVEAAGNYIKNKAINTGNYYAGAAGSVASDILSGVASGFDPRTVAVGKGEILDPDVQADFLNSKHGPVGPMEPTKPIEAPAMQSQPKLLGPAKDIQLPASTANQPSIAETANLGTGKPAELLHPNRIEPASEVINQLFPNGDAPPLHEVAATIHPPEANTTAAPGNVMPKPTDEKDISAALAYSGSADQILENRDATRGIVSAIRDNGWDKMQQSIGTQIRQLGDITQGLNKDQLQAFGRSAENAAGDLDKQILSTVPDIEARLTKYRELMDSIFSDAKVARKGDLGYIQDYVTHVQKEPEDFSSAMKEIFNYRQGKNAFKTLFESGELKPKGTGEAAGIYDQGTGNIGESAFAKERTGGLDNLDYNVNRLGRMYIESMARETYLRPAVDEAKGIVEGLPDSKLKELSEWYIRNVTRFDSAPQLHQAMRKFVRFMVDTTSRSLLGFSPRLQELHAMRLGPVYAELGPKYSAAGLGNMLRNPIQSYREAAELGLLPNELYPFKFQTAGERTDSILNFKSMVDFVDRTIAYNGSKAKYLGQGMPEPDAIKQAIVDAKRMTFQTDPSRATMMLNPSEPTMRLFTQFKQVPSKITEMLVRTATEAKQNPARARRMLTLLGANAASYAAGGPSMFHMPISLGDWSAASMNEMRKIMTYAVKGDVDKAVEETALWITPAGKSLQRLFQ